MTLTSKKITIAEIARLAEVSTGTVSRALNGRARISEDTRAKIMRIVKQTGFVPDQSAQRLARGTAQLIGVASAEGALRRPYYSYLLDSIQETFVAKGFAVRMLEPGEDAATDVCAGFIVPGLHVDDSRPHILLEKGIPTVVIGHPRDGCGCVEVTQHTGILEAMRHLTSLGHTRIAHLTGPPSGQEAIARLAAYRAGLEAGKLKFDPALVADGNFSDLDAYRVTRKMIEQGLQFTAVFAASDEMALGAMRALEDCGRRVPHDVSVVGYDDLPFARQSVPSLSTVRQPIRDIGHAAAQLLIEHLEGKPLNTVQIETHLMVRGSSAPPNAAHERGAN
jgi:LacI family transcriptional regulator